MQGSLNCVEYCNLVRTREPLQHVQGDMSTGTISNSLFLMKARKLPSLNDPGLSSLKESKTKSQKQQFCCTMPKALLIALLWKTSHWQTSSGISKLGTEWCE